MSFNISKRAMQVIIEPWDNAVDKAMKIIQSRDPGLLKNVKKIVVHPGTGSGQLGHVEMGPGKDPQEVHIFKDRIKQIVTQQSGNKTKTTLTTDELDNAIVNGIIETISHESGHIGRNRTPEQISKGPFFGEPEAEREAKSFMSKIQTSDDKKLEIKDSNIHGKGLFAKTSFSPDDYISVAFKINNTGDYKQTEEVKYINHSNKPNAEIIKNKDDFELYANKKIEPNDEITIDYDRTEKYTGIKGAKDFDRDGKIKAKASDLLSKSILFLSKFSEKFGLEVDPNLNFISNMKSEYVMTKNAFNSVKNNNSSITSELKDAIEFNKKEIVKSSTLKLLGIINDHIETNNFYDEDFVIRLSIWQAFNKLDVNGKLNKNTLQRFAELKHNTSNLPRNFSVVVPGNLYRGGMINDIEQLKNLKNMGIKQIISLHANPEISKMCNELSLINIPAFIENGYENETGRKIFGNSVSSILNNFPTYVHCFFGEDRTGAVIARYRTENGWPCDLAYKEAKAYGFKDMFADLIDWFSEPCGRPPIDTDKVRKMLNYKDPYVDPELEQECLSPVPTDVPYEGGLGYSDYITSATPTGISSIPIGIGSQGK